jgi:hypothetical protein
VTERVERAWHIVTGEYPPANGGVSDYTRLVARGLAARGDEVHVWAPGTASGLVRDAGVEVHALPGMFGPRALRELAAEHSGERVYCTSWRPGSTRRPVRAACSCSTCLMRSG